MASLFEHSVSRPHHEGASVRGRSIPPDPATLEMAHAAKCELAEKTLRLFGSMAGLSRTASCLKQMIRKLRA